MAFGGPASSRCDGTTRMRPGEACDGSPRAAKRAWWENERDPVGGRGRDQSEAEAARAALSGVRIVESENEKEWVPLPRAGAAAAAGV